MINEWRKATDPPPFEPETLKDWRAETPWVLVYESRWDSMFVAKFVAYPDELDIPGHWVEFGRYAYDCLPDYWRPLPEGPKHD